MGEPPESPDPPEPQPFDAAGLATGRASASAAQRAQEPKAEGSEVQRTCNMKIYEVQFPKHAKITIDSYDFIWVGSIKFRLHIILLHIEHVVITFTVAYLYKDTVSENQYMTLSFYISMYVILCCIMR